MPKPLNIIRSTRLNLAVPEDLRAKLDLFLWDSVSQRIPEGAYSQFFSARLREFFDKLKEDPSATKS